MLCNLCQKPIDGVIFYINKNDYRKKLKDIKDFYCSSCVYKYEDNNFPRFRQVCVSKEELEEYERSNDELSNNI